MISVALGKNNIFCLQSHNDDELSEGEGDSNRDAEDADSCDAMRIRNGNALAEQADVISKLKLQVRDIKV